MRSYRRNGTPIGDRSVYVVVPGPSPKAWEINGCSYWEEVPGAVALESIAGNFGYDFDPSAAIIVEPGCNLSKARLSQISLLLGDLRGAKMEGVILTEGSLMMADLRDANLYGARLAYANLAGADFRGADIRGADLSGAVRGKNEEEIPGWVVVDSRLSFKTR